MKIDLIFKSIRLILNQERNGQAREAQIETAVNLGQLNFLARQIKVYRDTGILPSSLRPLLVTTSVSLTDGNGSLPSDFEKEISFHVQGSNPFEGDFLSRGEFEDRRSQVIRTPTEQDPIATVEGSSVVVFPTSIGAIQMSYIREPVDVVYNYTVSGGRNITFVETGGVVGDGNSIDTDFAKEFVPDLVKEALLVLGVKQQDRDALALGTTQSQ